VPQPSKDKPKVVDDEEMARRNDWANWQPVLVDENGPAFAPTEDELAKEEEAAPKREERVKAMEAANYSINRGPHLRGGGKGGGQLFLRKFCS
jgi:hypothetical protein